VLNERGQLSLDFTITVGRKYKGRRATHVLRRIAVPLNIKKQDGN
jgi:hypothetical protein